MDKDAALLLARLAVGPAGMVDPSRAVAAKLGVDDAAVVQAEIEGVVGIAGIVRVALQRLLPRDVLALVLDHALAFGDGGDRVYALAVHARLAHLDPVARCLLARCLVLCLVRHLPFRACRLPVPAVPARSA
ncbi:hypothetical protein D9M72_453690 [compost metagenome]